MVRRMGRMAKLAEALKTLTDADRRVETSRLKALDQLTESLRKADALDRELQRMLDAHGRRRR